MVKKKTCIFISGQGSNLKNLIYHSRDKNFPIQISLVISNNKKANGINYAKKYKIPYLFIDTKIKNYENKILLNLKKYKISFICLAGYIKTGCTVHYVNDNLDDGEIIVKKSFYLSPNDNEKTLKQKTQLLEYKAYPEAIIKVFRNISS